MVALVTLVATGHADRASRADRTGREGLSAHVGGRRSVRRGWSRWSSASWMVALVECLAAGRASPADRANRAGRKALGVTMQCTSYIPVYYNERDIDVGANYGQERGSRSTFSVPQCTIEQYLGYEKEVMRRIIQNHEATFRYQVQELHRLYSRQTVLMDEISVGETFTQHLQLQTSKSNLCSSQARSHIFHASHTPSCCPAPFPSNNEFKAHDKRVLDLELPGNAFETPEVTCCTHKKPELVPANGSGLGYVKTGEDFSSFNTSSCKTKFMIDLNEPVQIESLDSSSDGTNSSVAIDLNSMPLSCLSETAINLENLQNLKKNTKDGDQEENMHVLREDSDCSSEIDDKMLKIKTYIDLNGGNEPFPPLSSTNVEMESAGEADLEAPVSPENKEGSPPRGKSEDIPILSQLDRIAANSLIMIFDSGVLEHSEDAREPLRSFYNPLPWFAEIVSSTGNDLENNATNFSRVVKKEKKAGTCSSRSKRGSARAGSNGCGKVIRNSKLDDVSKSTSAIWKQPSTRSKQGVLQNWGNVKKRRGGCRCRASKFLIIS
ncbi:hypothetical protein BUALT_Bualt07G0068800 [Buddleja alternifolia]|uniref:Uncharacterized protein n=1 Tax=Buddleja alternifolia TaxID=168488 RepID=A0AAV6XGU4_9LAMI|nr:hypothetical protein BUALT_Bualt07G0068800 [Buddleja alternifolia]